MILAADLGGTKTHFALFYRDGEIWDIFKEKKYKSADWTTMKEVISDFLKWSEVKLGQIEAASFSMAGPIDHYICHLTNLNRTINFEELKAYFNKNTPITFCNDLVATAAGISTLKSDDLYCFNPKVHRFVYSKRSFLFPNLNRAVIAPGTGLGESIILADGQICPTEGAHTDFAPQSELQIRLWRFLHLEYGHVSYERLLSGPGLVNLYRFFLSESISGSISKPVNHYLPKPEEITNLAHKGTCPLCMKALNLFGEILGAEAGNLALKSFATGGIFLGGGIPPKILDFLNTTSFLQSFQAKGRFQEFVKNIPVYVILNEKTALYGAAQRLLQQNSFC